MGRKYEKIGIAIGRAVWKEFLEKGREHDSVVLAISKYAANEIWRTSDGRYFITSYSRTVTPYFRSRILKMQCPDVFYVYKRVWLTKEDIEKLEEEGRLKRYD
jgi:hypothetical protein